MNSVAAAVCILIGTSALAQSPSSAPSPSTPKPARKAPAADVAAPAAAPESGWRIGIRPSWVVEPPAPTTATGGNNRSARSTLSRREELVDFQVNHVLPKRQTFVRLRSQAAEAGALGAISQPQVDFNPAFQNVTLHEAVVIRDGRRLDRLKDARIESMRREQRLEQQVIDGTKTLLVILSDVRIGESVEISYTIEGENPIYEGRIAGSMQLAWDTPIEQLHHRVLLPANRPIQLRTLSSNLQAELTREGAHQVLHLHRQRVDAIDAERQTPPWHHSFPVVQYSEFGSWAEVDAWAVRLFAQPVQPGPELLARLAQFKASGLAGEALVAEVLRFVQDDVRYFSVSLGESSHRPKTPEQTLSQRLGDCKDKVVLLNALLTGLGFDARPALVSMQSHRGIAQHLPSPMSFDHVVTQLVLDGKTWYLDPTAVGQGLTMAGRGQHSIGSALVVGDGTQLASVADAADAPDRVDFEQRWDLSRPDQPARLTAIVRTQGLTAEMWRNVLASGGEARIGEAVARGHARVHPGLAVAEPVQVSDDRQTNTVTLTQTFSVSNAGRYLNGSLELDLAAVELSDHLVAPSETRRRMPYHFSGTRQAASRIVVQAPRTFTLRTPAPLEVNDRHFRYQARVEVAGSSLSVERRFQRLTDQVASEDIGSFRENMAKARQAANGRVRVPLVDIKALEPEMEQIDRRLKSARGFRADDLQGILARNEFIRLVDTAAARNLDPQSPLHARVMASRAMASNLLGQFDAALADATQALGTDANLDDAREARAVALVGLGRLDESLVEFERLMQGDKRSDVRNWVGAVNHQLGRHAEAEKVLREAVENGGGSEREFALLWLYLAAEAQGGRGQAAIEPYLADTDAARLTGAMLRFLGGKMDRNQLLALARSKADRERLDMAEATFFIGMQHLARGQTVEARRWMARTVETGALPYREVTFARLFVEGRIAARPVDPAATVSAVPVAAPR